MNKRINWRCWKNGNQGNNPSMPFHKSDKAQYKKRTIEERRFPIWAKICQPVIERYSSNLTNGDDPKKNGVNYWGMTWLYFYISQPRYLNSSSPRLDRVEGIFVSSAFCGWERKISGSQFYSFLLFAFTVFQSFVLLEITGLTSALIFL